MRTKRFFGQVFSVRDRVKQTTPDHRIFVAYCNKPKETAILDVNTASADVNRDLEKFQLVISDGFIEVRSNWFYTTPARAQYIASWLNSSFKFLRISKNSIIKVSLKQIFGVDSIEVSDGDPAQLNLFK